MSNLIRRIPKSTLIFILSVISLFALGFISQSYPYGYFNPHVIGFITLGLWTVALIPFLWVDIHIKRNRGFRIFRFAFLLFLIFAAVVALIHKNAHYRIFYLITIIVLLLLLLMWKIYKSKRSMNKGWGHAAFSILKWNNIVQQKIQRMAYSRSWFRRVCLPEPALMLPERCSRLSAVGFNAAGFIKKTLTGRIFSTGWVTFSERPAAPVAPGRSCRTISMGISGAQAARRLSIGQPAGQRSVLRGDKIIREPNFVLPP
jgi:hypothetical protein